MEYYIGSRDHDAQSFRWDGVPCGCAALIPLGVPCHRWGGNRRPSRLGPRFRSPAEHHIKSTQLYHSPAYAGKMAQMVRLNDLVTGDPLLWSTLQWNELT